MITIERRPNYRQPLSIAYIGRRRFSLGVVLALAFAIVFYLFYGGIRDTTAVVLFALGYGTPVITPSRVQAGYLVDPTNPFGQSPPIRYAHNLFVAGVAVVIAQSVALKTWFGHVRGRTQTGRSARLEWALTGATMWTWLLPFFLFKFGQSYWLYVYLSTWSHTPEPELGVNRMYGWVLVLLVVVFFLEQWKGIRLVFRCGRWIIAASIVSIIVALTLALIQPLGL